MRRYILMLRREAISVTTADECLRSYRKLASISLSLTKCNKNNNVFVVFHALSCDSTFCFFDEKRWVPMKLRKLASISVSLTQVYLHCSSRSQRMCPWNHCINPSTLPHSRFELRGDCVWHNQTIVLGVKTTSTLGAHSEWPSVIEPLVQDDLEILAQ